LWEPNDIEYEKLGVQLGAKTTKWFYGDYKLHELNFEQFTTDKLVFILEFNKNSHCEIFKVAVLVSIIDSV
jgi:hypothetical protein